MITASCQVQNTNAVQLQITISMPLPEWKIIYQAIEESPISKHPKWPVLSMISKAIAGVERAVTDVQELS